MKKLLLAFFIVSSQLVFAPNAKQEQELTAIQQAIKAQILMLAKNEAMERERETKLLKQLNMEGRFGDEERQKVSDIASRLELEKDWIYLIIHKESRGNPKAVNKHSGATGLIQFLPRTARSLGTTTTKLIAMPTMEQLDYVEKYLQKVSKKYDITSYFQLYLSVFYPSAMGKGDTYVIGSKGSRTVSLNKGVDVNNDGILTVGDFRQFAGVI